MYIAHYSLFSKHIETLANAEDECRLRLSATENTGSHASMHTNPQDISLVRKETSYTKEVQSLCPTTDWQAAGVPCERSGTNWNKHVPTRQQRCAV